MRTKTLLITAALSLAGVATSMAQVYSVNAVGYINLTMVPGFNMVANQLNRTPNNLLNNVITGVPVESQVLKFDSVTANYTAEFFDGAKWINPESGADGVLTANPGNGIFFFNPSAAALTVTLVGEVPQGTGLQVALPSGFALISSIVPQTIPLTLANGFPQTAEAQFLGFNAATQNYDAVILNDGDSWINPETGADLPPPSPAVGQGFFYFNPGGPTTWSRNFSVN